MGQNANPAGSPMEVKDILGQLTYHIGLGSGWAHWAVGAQTSFWALRWWFFSIFVSAVNQLLCMVMEKVDYMPESPSDGLLRSQKKVRQFLGTLSVIGTFGIFTKVLKSTPEDKYFSKFLGSCESACSKDAFMDLARSWIFRTHTIAWPKVCWANFYLLPWAYNQFFSLLWPPISI